MRMLVAICLPLASAALGGCRPSGPPAIAGVEWTLVELAGRPAATGSGAQPATLRLAPDGPRAAGFAGCNHLAGTYRLSGDSLVFRPLIPTKMACSTEMDLEQAYLDALAATRTYRTAAGRLELAGERGVLARFESR